MVPDNVRLTPAETQTRATPTCFQNTSLPPPPPPVCSRDFLPTPPTVIIEGFSSRTPSIASSATWARCSPTSNYTARRQVVLNNRRTVAQQLAIRGLQPRRRRWRRRPSLPASPLPRRKSPLKQRNLPRVPFPMLSWATSPRVKGGFAKVPPVSVAAPENREVGEACGEHAHVRRAKMMMMMMILMLATVSEIARMEAVAPCWRAGSEGEIQRAMN